MSASLLARGSTPNEELSVMVPQALVSLISVHLNSILDTWNQRWIYWVYSTHPLRNYIWNWSAVFCKRKQKGQRMRENG